MIHLYQNNGYNIVLDVNSGAVHVVDQAAYDVIGVLEKQNEFHTPETLREPETAADLKKELGSRYGEEDIEDILEAVITLTEEGQRLAESIYERHVLFSEVLSKLGVDRETAKKDACRMEHVLSEDSFKVLKKYFSQNGIPSENRE